jgi:hypothetical protein
MAGCFECRAELTEGARFCPQCGARQEAPPEPERAVVPTAPTKAGTLLARAAAPAAVVDRPRPEPAPVTAEAVSPGGLAARRGRPTRIAVAPVPDAGGEENPFAALLSGDPRPVARSTRWNLFARGATR